MYVKKEVAIVTTIADGSQTAYTERINGRILSIHYTKPASGSYTDGVDFTITTETTGQVVWDEDNVNASTHRVPRQATHDGVGVASLYAAGGEPVESFIYVCEERIKIVLAAGGDTKAGTFTVVFG